MSISDASAQGEVEDTREVAEVVGGGERQKLEREIDIEISKLTFYSEQIDDLLQDNDIEEIKLVSERMESLQGKILALSSQVQELKISEGETSRDVRQWKRNIKEVYTPLIERKERLVNVLKKQQSRQVQDREREIMRESQLKHEIEQRRLAEVQEQQAKFEEMNRRQRFELEKQLWEQKMKAELEIVEKKMEMEKSHQIDQAKLPKLRITAFNGTASDWVRFENMFVTQVHNKNVTDEVKFGYLLEMVCPKVRDKISNLRPGPVGYKTAWERLTKEYGQTQMVVNAHVNEIISLPVIRGTSYWKTLSFYEKLSKSFDALQTLGKGDTLTGLVMTTINKLPHVKPDVVRTDDEWEQWDMGALIENLTKWLKRNKPEEQMDNSLDTTKREKHWFSKGESRISASKLTRQGPNCIFCKESHWADACQTYDTLEKRRKFFVERRLCFNCGKHGHRENKCHSRGCFKCKSKHHTSLCDMKEQASSTWYAKQPQLIEEKTLPAIVPLKIQGETFWAHLDTGAGRDFISKDAAKTLQLKPIRYEVRHLMTVNGTKKQSLPIYQITINSLDGISNERIEVTGVDLPDFTTVERPSIKELKEKFKHTRDKRFYTRASNKYTIHLILGDNTFCRIKTQEVFKGQKGEPIIEGTTFGYIIHGGDKVSNSCMYVKETEKDFERLYSLDILGIEDRGENDASDIHYEFNENITQDINGRYEVKIPWIPGQEIKESNEAQSRSRLRNVERKLSRNPELREAYQNIIKEQIKEGVVEKIPDIQTGERKFYLPHKPVVREEASTTKVRMVFDASARPSPLSNSLNECMYTGPALQPNLWDILVRARMGANLLIGDLKKAFLQVGITQEDKDAFRFLFNINGKEEHLRFVRVPFGAEASPFILGATLNYHFDKFKASHTETVKDLSRNTYVDNLMTVGSNRDELETFKRESTEILEKGKFHVHKWESNIPDLESEGMSNPSKILGLPWDKKTDTIEVQILKINSEESQNITKKVILSKLGSIYDPLGLISPTLVEGKRIYREACEESNQWNKEVSPELTKDWLKWTSQLKNVKVPRSLIKSGRSMKGVHIHQFADASQIACSTATIAVIEHETEKVMGLLTSRSRIAKRNTSIARSELISGVMAANMVKNLCKALQDLPILSVTIWMDSMVALYWIHSPRKAWKTFVANRVRKISEATEENNITWKHCTTDMNIADLGSRGASIEKTEKGRWIEGPEWLFNEEHWPRQPEFKSCKKVNEEARPFKEVVAYSKEKAEIRGDEWDLLLERKPYWTTFRVTAWALRFKENCKLKCEKKQKVKGPLTTEEIRKARDLWIVRAQKEIDDSLERPGWKLEKDPKTGILRCIGRIQNYEPIYLENNTFTQKLIQYEHERINHLGLVSTMSEIRENWHILHLRALVKRYIRQCNVCKVFTTKPFDANITAPLPKFRTEASRPFEYTGVDFAGPITYKVNKKEEGKAYIIIFTCATIRAVHLEVVKSQLAVEFQRKLNAFIARKTRPKVIISDNAKTFKATADWIKKLRKSEELHDFLAKQDIRWKFNLSKSPWWGAFYERLIKDVKGVLYKTLGRSHLSFEHFENVILDIERHLNNRPLTYIESEVGEGKVLTPNILMWGQDAHTFDDIEIEVESVTKFQRRLENARVHVWRRWSQEYIKSLMDHHRINRSGTVVPEIGEVVLIVGDEKNRGLWMKGRVLKHVTGKDGVIRGAIVLHKGNRLERPLQLLCPLEIKSELVERNPVGNTEQTKPTRRRREAAEDAQMKTKLILEDE